MESQTGARVKNGCGRRGGGRRRGWGRERREEGKGVWRGAGREREEIGVKEWGWRIVVEVEVKGVKSGLRTG